MKSSPPRITLVPAPRDPRRPAIRRYRLGRVIGDLGPVLAAQRPAPVRARANDGH
jgi:hypothetical protein